MDVKKYLLALLLLFCVSCDSEWDMAGVEAGNATLAGVLRSAQGSPMGGVTVGLYKKGSSNSLAKDVTDAHGAFAFTGLGAGTYTVKAALEDGYQVVRTVGIEEGDAEIQVTLDASDALPVATGKDLSE